jgi:hypothetical protein
MNKINVVVSRYNKNTDFVYNLKEITPVKIMVYDKCNPRNPYNVPVNIGREASVFLKYIIDHYNKLPEFTFFIHDEDRSWHHEGTIAERFKEALDSNKMYYNINNANLRSITHVRDSERELFLDYYKNYIQEYIPYEKIPEKDWFLSGKISAQFLVHKSLITNLPRKFYKRLYDYCTLPDQQTGHKGVELSAYFLEWTWHLFWDIYPTMKH